MKLIKNIPIVALLVMGNFLFSAAPATLQDKFKSAFQQGKVKQNILDVIKLFNKEIEEGIKNNNFDNAQTVITLLKGKDSKTAAFMQERLTVEQAKLAGESKRMGAVVSSDPATILKAQKNNLIKTIEENLKKSFSITQEIKGLEALIKPIKDLGGKPAAREVADLQTLIASYKQKDEQLEKESLAMLEWSHEHRLSTLKEKLIKIDQDIERAAAKLAEGEKIKEPTVFEKIVIGTQKAYITSKKNERDAVHKEYTTLGGKEGKEEVAGELKRTAEGEKKEELARGGAAMRSPRIEAYLTLVGQIESLHNQQKTASHLFPQLTGIIDEISSSTGDSEWGREAADKVRSLIATDEDIKANPFRADYPAAEGESKERESKKEAQKAPPLPTTRPPALPSSLQQQLEAGKKELRKAITGAPASDKPAGVKLGGITLPPLEQSRFESRVRAMQGESDWED